MNSEHFEPALFRAPNGRGKRFWITDRLEVVEARLPVGRFDSGVFAQVYHAVTGHRWGVDGMVNALLRTGRVRRELAQPGPHPKRRYVYERVVVEEADILDARRLMGLEPAGPRPARERTEMKRTTLTCDLCSSVILPGTAYCTLTMPIPPDLREAIMRNWHEQVQAPAPGGRLIGLFTPTVPTSYQLELCRCIRGLIPELDRIVRDQLTEFLQRRALAADRQQADEDAG